MFCDFFGFTSLYAHNRRLHARIAIGGVLVVEIRLRLPPACPLDQHNPLSSPPRSAAFTLVGIGESPPPPLPLLPPLLPPSSPLPPPPQRSLMLRARRLAWSKDKKKTIFVYIRNANNASVVGRALAEASQKTFFGLRFGRHTFLPPLLLQFIFARVILMCCGDRVARR